MTNPLFKSYISTTFLLKTLTLNNCINVNFSFKVQLLQGTNTDIVNDGEGVSPIINLLTHEAHCSECREYTIFFFQIKPLTIQFRVSTDFPILQPSELKGIGYEEKTVEYIGHLEMG